MSFRSLSALRNPVPVFAALLALGAIFQACQPGGRGGSSEEGGVTGPDSTTVRDTSSPIILFKGSAPLNDTGIGSLESGTERSATGELNPDVFVEGKSPLQRKGARLVLNLFDSVSFTAVVDSSQKLGEGRYTAYGTLTGLKGSSFIASCENGALSALVTVPDEGTFRVEFAGGSKYRAVRQNGYAPSCPPTPVPNVKLDSSAAPAPLRKIAAGPVTIDIAVLYTAAAVAGAKSVTAMNNLVDLAVAQANEAYRNSRIDVTLNLVYRGQVNYAESGVIGTDLARLQSSDDAYLADAHTIRDAFGADVVTLITETGESQYAGLGYVLSQVNPAYAAYAFNVVRRAYASGYGVLAHEVGHNMGCMHDAENSANPGAYAYSYGYRWNGTNGRQYRDVMAYAPGTLVNYFSNPAVTYMGALTGAEGRANSALTISNTAASLAAYRAHLPLKVTLTSPLEGSRLTAPANVILNATVENTLTATKVEFYSGTQLLGIDATAPYSYSWNPLEAGTYTVTAKVYTKSGATETSVPVTFKTEWAHHPGNWSDVFVGNAGVAGTLVIDPPGDDAEFTVTGTGMGMVGGTDGFHFANLGYGGYILGDSWIASEIKSISSSDPGALAGVMIRESLAANARFAFIGRNPAGDVFFLRRASVGGAVSTTKVANAGGPKHYRVMRKGNDFAAYTSSDGRTWTLVGGHLFTMPAMQYVGLAVSSNSLTKSNTAVFRKPLIFYGGGTDFPPSATLTGPANGSTFNPGTLLSFSAAVLDRDGPKDIQLVQFFNTDEFGPDESATGYLGKDEVAPYTLSWKAASGTARIFARVLDQQSSDGYSPPLVYTITGPGQWVTNPTADTYVRDGSSAAQNMGSAASLQVRSSATAGNTYESHLKFRIDSLATIASAKLRVYGNALGGTDTVQVALYPVDSTGWLESGTKSMIWNNKPALGAKMAQVKVAGTALRWVEYDVTEYVKTRKAAGATLVGFALQGATQTTAYAAFNVRSSATGKPELFLADH
jgi:hypothetical protein